MRRLTQEEAINGYAWANDSIRLNKETFERETSDISKMVSIPIYDEVKDAVEYGIAFQRNAIWHKNAEDKPTSSGSTYITLCRNKNKPDGIWLADICQWEDGWAGRTNWEDVVLWTEIENILPVSSFVRNMQEVKCHADDADDDCVKRSCENCKYGSFHGKTDKEPYCSVFCYLHKDCAQDEPIEIIDDDFVETAENCENYEEENKNG